MDIEEVVGEGRRGILPALAGDSDGGDQPAAVLPSPPDVLVLTMLLLRGRPKKMKLSFHQEMIIT